MTEQKARVSGRVLSAAVGPAADAVLQSVSILAEHLEGLADPSDMEAVHRVRVASRRLDALLAAYSPVLPTRTVSNARSALKTLLGSLGRARDLDVALQYLERLDRAGLSRAHLSGLGRIALRISMKRERSRRRVGKALTMFAMSESLAGLGKMARRLAASADPSADPLPAVMILASRAMRAAAAPLAGLDSALADESDEKAHHRSRILVKKARYSLESFAGRPDLPLDERIAFLRTVQTMLGTIHDCDVWMSRLDSFEKREEKLSAAFFGSDAPFRAIRPGVEYLREVVRIERVRTFKRLAKAWRRAGGARFLDPLMEDLDAIENHATGMLAPAEASDGGAGGSG